MQGKFSVDPLKNIGFNAQKKVIPLNGGLGQFRNPASFRNVPSYEEVKSQNRKDSSGTVI